MSFAHARGIAALILAALPLAAISQSGQTKTAPKPAATAPAPAAKPAPTPAAFSGPTKEQQAQIVLLKEDIAKIEKSLADAKAEDDALAGGLIKSLIRVRMEIYRSTIAMLDQRIKAYETGAREIKVPAPFSPPDPATAETLEKEIAISRSNLASTQADAAKYSGGLIRAQLLSTAATQAQTISLLEQRRLAALYGLGLSPSAASATPAATASASTSTPPPAKAQRKAMPGEGILTVKLITKRYTEQKYEKGIYFTMEITASGLDQPARSIKGRLEITDLFGETRLPIKWVVEEPIAPGQTITIRDQGISYNQFKPDHKWLNSTELENMAARYVVESILYQDGSRKDF